MVEMQPKLRLHRLCGDGARMQVVQVSLLCTPSLRYHLLYNRLPVKLQNSVSTQQHITVTRWILARLGYARGTACVAADNACRGSVVQMCGQAFSRQLTPSLQPHRPRFADDVQVAGTDCSNYLSCDLLHSRLLLPPQ